MYDSIIIGAGPAGLTAGIYLARAGYKTLILEKETIGGQISSSPMVENYPGYIQISGGELADKLYDQVINLGVDLEIATVTMVKDGKKKKVITEDGEYEAKTIIIATGSKPRTLGLATEEQFLGRGIHFCVSCDGAFYKNRTVAVIGGGNSAITNALYLADLGAKVYVVQNLADLTSEEKLNEKLKATKNVEIFYNAIVQSFNGQDELESITIKTQDQIRDLKVDGVFEAVGMNAQTDLVDNLLTRNEANYIVSENCETQTPGIFVAGDCREKEIRQLTTATADGTTAAYAAIKYLRNI